jgi:hypothetical protein
VTLPLGVYLRCRDTRRLPDTSSLVEPAPADNRGFVEATEYAFEKPGSGWILRVDDQPLSDLPGNPAEWLWTPQFFAGEVTAELIDPDGTSTLFLLDVAPDPRKLGRELFREMIDELWAADPTFVIGSEPATSRIGDLGPSQDAWLELSRYRRYVPEFLRAIRLVQENPRRALRARREWIALRHVRRVDRRTAAGLVRSPAAALFFARSNEAPDIPDDTALDVPVTEETLDSAANRAMLALLLALIRRGQSLLARLQELVGRQQESETRTSLHVRWPARRQLLETLTSRLKVVVRQYPFVLVKRGEIAAAGLNAIAADPAYARAWSQGWRALRHGFESGERTERLWVSPSWEIYERWCFVRLGKLLAAVMPPWQWAYSKASHRWIAESGPCRCELRLQPTFRSNLPSANGMWSISRERVPDIVLTIEDAEGVRFVVFDAKYRASRANVLEAMESAHIYQDSLRIGSRRAEVSLLLIPSAGGAEWLEDHRFQAEHRVGVHPFSPASTEPPAIVKKLFESG